MIIINADDFGISKEVNSAIEFLLVNNKINSTTLMANTEYFNDAVKSAKTNSFDDKIGVHLNLTFGIPILEKTKNSFLCTDGVFNKNILKKKYNLFISRKNKKIIYNEFKAQIDKIYSNGINITHIDSHQHIHNNFILIRMIKNIAKEYSIPYIRISRNVFKNKISKNKKFIKLIFNKLYIGKKSYSSEFGDYNDFLEHRFNCDNIEVMVHPIMQIDGSIIDVSLNIKLN